MNWRIKAVIQNAAAALPSSLSYGAYYWLQRHFGGLRRVDPFPRLADCVRAAMILRAHGRSPLGSTILEIGTGRTLTAPLAFWLMGAKKVFTVDLNPYLKEELVREELRAIGDNRGQVRQIFARCVDETRLETLQALADGTWQLDELLRTCDIDYFAPADAAALPLDAESVDVHTSFCVLEHIPPKALEAILLEGNRVVGSNGILIHKTDHTDHFAHSDKSISSINFLQFEEGQWDKYAGNRYMYMNRLRVDELEDVFREAHQNILSSEREMEPAALELLQTGRIKLAPRFAGKPNEVLAAAASWIVSEPLKG